MNKSQILILWSGILVIVVMLLFPPYRFVLEKSTYQGISINPQTSVSGPYRLIFLGVPNIPVTSTSTSQIYGVTYTNKYYKDHDISQWKSEFDIPRLLIPISIVVIITIGLIITFNRKDEDTIAIGGGIAGIFRSSINYQMTEARMKALKMAADTKLPTEIREFARTEASLINNALAGLRTGVIPSGFDGLHLADMDLNKIFKPLTKGQQNKAINVIVGLQNIEMLSRDTLSPASRLVVGDKVFYEDKTGIGRVTKIEPTPSGKGTRYYVQFNNHPLTYFDSRRYLQKVGKMKVATELTYEKQRKDILGRLGYDYKNPEVQTVTGNAEDFINYADQFLSSTFEHGRRIDGTIAEPMVIFAVRKYFRLNEGVRNDLIDRGKLDPDQIWRYYYPRMLVDAIKDVSIYVSYANKGMRQISRNYTKLRHGSERAMKTNLKSLRSHLARVYGDNLYDDALDRICANANVYRQFDDMGNVKIEGTHSSDELLDLMDSEEWLKLQEGLHEGQTYTIAGQEYRVMTPQHKYNPDLYLVPKGVYEGMRRLAEKRDIVRTPMENFMSIGISVVNIWKQYIIKHL